jgi:integrase
MLGDWLVLGQVIPTNPASSVRGPKYVCKRGKTPVLSAQETRTLLDAIDVTTLAGLRDRALIGVMVYSFARIGAVVGMRVQDYCPRGKRWWFRLHEKGGKHHEVPAHHNAEAYMDAYLQAAGITGDKKRPLFRTIARAGALTERPMSRIDALKMVKRRARAAHVSTAISCHTFRATGITAYLENGGTIENAQAIAAHESPRTTKLYDRTSDEITLDEACSVEVTSSGLLGFRFRWMLPGKGLRKFAEATALPDTPANRERVNRQAELIGAEIRAGAFDYLDWFPNGNRAADFLAASRRQPTRPTRTANTESLTVRRYYDEWIAGKVVPDVRASLARDYRAHFKRYILDVLGDTPLDELALPHLEDLRLTLRKRGLAEKSIRNVIDCSLRAMVRDALHEDVEAGFPFPRMRWPEKIVPGPSPFTAEERDEVLRYFRNKLWKVGGFNDTKPHYPYFALLYSLFFTGMRPSEAIAVRIGSVNLRARTIEVDRSRHLGVEAAPKTSRSRRAVRLTKDNAAVLEPLIPLKARPEGYLFTNVRAEPIDAANFYDLFRDGQRALEITPLRDLYSTKDTYLSLALTNGVSLTWLSEQTGVAVATILNHYGRFIHSSETDDYELAKIENPVQFGHRLDTQLWKTSQVA